MSIIKQTAQELIGQQVAGLESGQDFQRIKDAMGAADAPPDSAFGKIFGDVFKDLKLGDGMEEEIEYSFFLYLTPEQLKAVMEKYGQEESNGFIECKIPCADKERKVRARQYYTGRTISRCELTTKKHAGEKKKLEFNSEISKENFMSLAWTSPSVTSRVRLRIPVLDKEGKQIPKRGHGFLTWELDLYFSPTLEGIHPWAKLELEVSAAKLSDDAIIKAIPFEYEELMLSDTQEPEQRKLITTLYNEQYNMIAHDTSFLEGKA